MPEIIRNVTGDNTLYAVWHIEESVADLLSMLDLNAEESVLFASFVAESRKKQWLAYRLLLRQLPGTESCPVRYAETGKPYLAGTNMHLSVSHTADLAAVILSKNARVGIDLEQVRPRIEKVVHKFMSPDEIRALKAGKELEQMTLVWSAKEALYKLFGQRNLDFRDEIRVIPPDAAGMKFPASIHTGGKDYQYTLESLMIRNTLLVYVVE